MREPLFLPAGQVCGPMLEGHVQPDEHEAFLHPLPDFVRWHAKVFSSEGNVIPHPAADHLRVRVLEHHSYGSSHSQSAVLFSLVVSGDEARDEGEQCGLPGAGVPRKKHTLPPVDGYRYIRKRGCHPGCVRIGEVNRLDRDLAWTPLGVAISTWCHNYLFVCFHRTLLRSRLLGYEVPLHPSRTPLDPTGPADRLDLADRPSQQESLRLRAPCREAIQRARLG